MEDIPLHQLRDFILLAEKSERTEKIDEPPDPELVEVLGDMENNEADASSSEHWEGLTREAKSLCSFW